MNVPLLKGKDLIVIAIFTVLIVVLLTAIGMIMMVSIGIHMSMLLGGGLGILFTMPVFMLMAAKVKKPGVIFLLALLEGLIYTLMSTPLMLLLTIVPGLIGELVVSIPKKNKSLSINALGYTVYSTIYALHGTFIVLFVGKDNFREFGKAMFTDDQITALLGDAFDVKLILITVVFTIVCGFISYFIGKRLLRKNFQKAGVI